MLAVEGGGGIPPSNSPAGMNLIRTCKKTCPITAAIQMLLLTESSQFSATGSQIIYPTSNICTKIERTARMYTFKFSLHSYLQSLMTQIMKCHADGLLPSTGQTLSVRIGDKNKLFKLRTNGNKRISRLDWMQTSELLWTDHMESRGSGQNENNPARFCSKGRLRTL